LAAEHTISIYRSLMRKTSVCVLTALVLTALPETVLAQTRSLGVDISAWQGNLSQSTWNSFAGAGNRDFAFIRSSRGGTTGYYNQSNSDNDPPTNTLSQRYDDPYFVQNITRATNAGMFAGAYHFGRMDIIESTLNANGIANNGTDEANHFIQMAGPWMRPGYLLPIFDHEAGISQRTPNGLAQFAIDFSNRIYEEMGIRPGIYIGGSYSDDLESASQALQNQITQTYPTTWHPRWPNESNPDAIDVQTGHPKDTLSYIYGPWDDNGTTHPWSFWQYTSKGRLTGYNGDLDLNVAQGGTDFLKDKLIPAVWMNDSNGDWSTLTNWNSGVTPVAPQQGPGQVARVGTMVLPTPRLPGADDVPNNVDGQNDTVILDRPNANITVTLSSGSHNIRKLYVRETLNITGGSLTINYTPVADSTPISAQFSAHVNLAGNASFTVHTLQVDAASTFTLAGGTLSANKINLMPHSSTPAKIILAGDVAFNPVNDVSSSIVVGSGTGSGGFVDLNGEVRKLTVGDASPATDLTISVPLTNGGFHKSGPGTLRLTGANTYSGDTIVEEGMLRLYTPYLSDTSDVYLTTGSVLNINFGVATDIIDSLFIDGVMQPAGIWGPSGSGAQYTSSLITGTGVLQVMTAPISIAGDFDGDGDVDGNDLLVWQDSYRNGTDGDADNDGDTDGRDFLIWQQNYTGPGTLSAESISVPEPSTLALALLTFTAVGVTRRK
jgi:autotransporter-associated beta strand protein